MTTEASGRDKKISVGIAAIIAGWILTLATLLWNTASTNASYSHRLEKIESDLIGLDARLDTSESYRMQLASDLAEIKTDLLWIRKELERSR